MEMNLYEAIKDRRTYLGEKKVKSWIYQVLKALDFMHRNGIFHRDIKPENILLRGKVIKLADLGSCKGIYNKPPFTEYISTRWYRSPECLLTDGHYNYKMDIWGLGCVFFEMLTLTPLFPGDNELDQVNKINQIIGSPSDELFEKFVKFSSHRSSFNFENYKGVGLDKFLSHCTPSCINLVKKMLKYDPDERYTARQCLDHEFFSELREREMKQLITKKISIIGFRGNTIMNSKININQSNVLGNFNDSSYLKVNDSFNNGNNNAERNMFNNMLHSNIKTLKFKKEPNISNSSIHYSNKNIDKSKNLQSTGKVGLPEINSKNNNNNVININNSNSNNEDSKFEDSTYRPLNEGFYLPKIMIHKKKFWGEYGNFMKSNEFKKLKHNISNHSIEKGLVNINTQYEKKGDINIRKRIKELKKYYVSPYSKKTIEQNILI